MTPMTETQQVTGTVQFVTKKGNPAEVQAGSVKWTATDPTVVDLVVDPVDEKTVTVKGKAAGSTRVDVTADADLGDGVESITLSEDFSITAGRAVGGTIVFGTPVEQP